MGSVHEEFDEAKWVRRFPLEKLRDEARAFVVQRRRELPNEYRSEAAFERHVKLMMPKWTSVGSPRSLATDIQLRWESWPAEPPTDAVPTDVFVWCEGEPANRAVTKVGGLPYWPVDRDWPELAGPMYFVAQFNFSDSLDLRSNLPGDILTIFVEDQEFYEPSAFRFEWVKATDQPVVEELPVAGWWSSKPVFGQRFRTWDHADFGIFEATKIGGLPYEVQGDMSLPGTHLATLRSVDFSSRDPHPMVNRDAPLSREDASGFFGIGDAGSLYIYIDDQGRVHADNACY